MKGWSTLFTVLGVLSVILAVAFLSVGFLVSAISCFFFSSLCNRITDVLDNQKKILCNQDEILGNQDRLRVMVSNLDK